MIKIDNFNTYGWESAVRGMRNPMNSWDKSDSGVKCDKCTYLKCQFCDEDKSWKLGANDLDLMRRLRKGGSDDRKYLRQIFVTCDITAPLYWWKEMDQYKVGTVTNSCSTMHKIAAKPFELTDFSCEHLGSDLVMCPETWIDAGTPVDLAGENMRTPLGILELTIDALNHYRDLYLSAKSSHDDPASTAKRYWWLMIQLLPSSYNQLRTWSANYEVLANIYHARSYHKLDEWRIFCKQIEKLPYARELIIGE